MKAHLITKLLAVAALAATVGLHAAEAPADKSQARAAAQSASDVKKDMEKFNAQRDAMLAERQTLINQLKNATEAQRKAILEKMKEIGDSQRELSKQIREDIRKLRQSQGSSGRS